MTHEEARLEIDATTLRPQDASEQARDLLAADDGLRQWAEQRRSTDELMADAFADLPVPEGLKEKLLAHRLSIVESTSAKKRPVLRNVAWLAAAAALVVAALTVFRPTEAGANWENGAVAMLDQINDGRTKLDRVSRDLEDLKGVLARRNCPVPSKFPTGLADLPRIGCKAFEIEGRPASVICFEIGEGKEAHLVVLDNSTAERPPALHKVIFEDRGGWHTAKWSDGTHTYLVGTKAAEGELKQLFALVADVVRGSVLI